MAYTYDLSNSIGLVRLQSGDKLVDGTAFFTDEEITLFITQSSNDTGKASILALRTWARALARKAKQQIGDYTYDPAAMAKTLLAAADALADELGDETEDPQIGDCGGELLVRW